MPGRLGGCLCFWGPMWPNNLERGGINEEEAGGEACESSGGGRGQGDRAHINHSVV